MHASIVNHVFRSSTELLVALDHFVDCIKKVFFCHRLPACSDCVHSRLCAHTSNIRTCIFKNNVTSKLYDHLI
ncbi:hypothetical protein Hanom_Chr10g00947661 [Helianthus anomalus]